MSLRLIVHGGVDSAPAPEVLAGLERAAAAGFDALSQGGDAVSAVESAVGVLEEDPLFNAGFGSVLNEAGEVETDAGIVDGTQGRFAAVAALTDVRRPSSVATELLRQAPGPVFLAGAGAKRFAIQIGMATDDLRTSEQVDSWERARRSGDVSMSPFTGRAATGTDTVGAIALDAGGRLAAGSSTGGVQLKLPGRVGDSAVFGAGIFADAERAALCSGLGEAAIELILAFRAVARCAAGDAVDEAAAWAVDRLTERHAVGGVVLFDGPTDHVAVVHNAQSFPVLLRDERGPRQVGAVPRSGRSHG